MTKKNSSKQHYGFTIIEVVLVLAIAGLIFLMVFVALPMLQRNQRNTQRKDDLARFLTAVEDYQSNNNGRLPFQNSGTLQFSQFIARYIDNSCNDRQGFQGINVPDTACRADQFRDPDGSIYMFDVKDFTRDLRGADRATATGAIAQPGTPDMTAHRIFAVTSAVCGTTEGTIARASGNRYVAMLMVLEGGGITCVTNGARGDVGAGPIGTITLSPDL